MTDSLAVLGLGFLLGMRHATDADHVVAVTTIVSRYRSFRAAAWIGISWGIGHTLTILAVGGGIVAFKWVIPPRIGLSMELAVGAMLVLLGAGTVVSLLRARPAAVGPAPGGLVHSHAHEHGDFIHTHRHGHEPEAHPHPPDRTPVHWLDRHFGRLGIYRAGRPLVIGMVHGLAGSAAVALLVLTTISDPGWAAFYLLVFGLGTLVGMMLLTTALATPFVYSARRWHAMSRGLTLGAGLLSVAMGLIVAYQVAVTGGLFGPDPRWLPK
jgi:high-affinity nickel-transport protein